MIETVIERRTSFTKKKTKINHNLYHTGVQIVFFKEDKINNRQQIEGISLQVRCLLNLPCYNLIHVVSNILLYVTFIYRIIYSMKVSNAEPNKNTWVRRSHRSSGTSVLTYKDVLVMGNQLESDNEVISIVPAKGVNSRTFPQGNKVNKDRLEKEKR